MALSHSFDLKMAKSEVDACDGTGLVDKIQAQRDMANIDDG